MNSNSNFKIWPVLYRTKPVPVRTGYRRFGKPWIWGALLFDCLRCILVFLIFIVLRLNIAPIFKRTPVWFFFNFRFKRQYSSVSEFNPPLTATWRPLWGQMAPQSRHKETRIDLLRLMNECLMIASKNWIASVIKRFLGFLSEFAWQCQCRPSISLSSPQAPITFRFCTSFQLANTHIIGTPAAARQKWSTKLQMLSYSIPRIITNIALPAGNQASINNKQKITAYKLLWLP